MPDKTFFRVTNKAIYEKLENQSEMISEVLLKQIETNGKVKLNRWMATTALTLIIVVVGLIVGGF